MFFLFLSIISSPANSGLVTRGKPGRYKDRVKLFCGGLLAAVGDSLPLQPFAGKMI